jgi:NAD(P)-dependent dehydrogenase (short-subunit alcohol dehydrogenase family)
MSKTVIIGSSSGIGECIATLLQNQKCITISRSIPNKKIIEHEHFQLDVIKDNLPEINDVNSLIYCPGTINLKPFGSLKEEDFLNDMQINFFGAIKTIKHFFRTLKKQQNASILLFSTVAVSQGMPFHASIASAKGAIEGLTKSLAAEFAGKIRVNCIAPTLTDTPLAKGILRNEDAINRSNQRHPTNRINVTNDIAKTALFLLEDNNITGQIIRVDGGLSTLKV